jgi:hypothetical protein
MGWHRLRDGEVPWGDYGRMLVTGMAERDADGIVAIERVGPFVPPVALYGLWDILVVTDGFRRQIEGSGLTGFSFAETRKKRIVRIDWRSWDLSAEDPEKYPAGGEPESYILGRKHNPQVAAELGPLWEVAIHGSVEDSTDDFARAKGWRRQIVVSDLAKDWLASEVGEWLSFEPFSASEARH